MLRVSIHAGAPAEASRYNQLAWLDIAYEQLAPLADYKTVLFQKGVGASTEAPLYAYPRWSASLWDLVARAIALGLRTEDFECLNEEVPEVVLTRKGCAFAKRINVLVEHAVTTGSTRRRLLACADIAQEGRFRGKYVARFEEHTMGRHTTEPFEYRPDFFRPAELVLHACLMRLSGKAELPPRPALCAPDAIEKDGRRHVPIHRLVEPARTGFVSWLHQQGEEPLEHPGARLGIAPEALYVRFLSRAI